MNISSSSFVDGPAVRDIHQRMIDAWNAGDAVAFAAPFTDDADFIAFEGTHLQGRAAITSFHEQLFETVLRGSRLEGEVRFVRPIGPAQAAMHSIVRVTLPSESRPSPSRDSMQLTTVSCRSGEWRVEALMNARRISLDRQYFLDDIDALPAGARREVDALLSGFKGLRPPAPTAPRDDPEFAVFMQKFERAIEVFMNGDNRPWLELASRRDDATIMGSWGAYERGWGSVGARYNWAASQFRPSGTKPTVEYLASGSSGDLAYTVSVERADPLIAGHAQRRPSQLRVTHVFRKEDGQWRFVHRHADPLIDKTTPA
jgi:uncharacterized protein (TIGR02246 family)